VTASVGLVIPVFQPDIDCLLSYVQSLDEKLELETIRIELDAPCERTMRKLSELPTEINAVSRRRGKGAAITAGFEELGTDILLFTDADGATPVNSIANVLHPVRNGSADLAVGSRRHPDAKNVTHNTLVRKHLGDGFAWLSRKLLSVELSDYQCGAKALTATAWESAQKHLSEAGFAWDIELIAVAGALDLKIQEVPVEWHDQPKSTVAPIRDSFRLALALIMVSYKSERIHYN
jgi:glycosyltransferase involved in cell wall biosynthesis